MWIELALCLSAAPQRAQVVPQQPQAPSARPSRGWRLDQRFVYVDDWDGALEVALDEVTGRTADLYVKRGAPPTLLDYDFRAATPNTSDERLVIDASTSPELTTGYWFIGVWREDGTVYDITFDGAPVASARPGLGALPYTDPGTGASGTTFRVFAPNAHSVHLRGPFNGWSQTRTPLVDEGNGNWSVDIRALGAGTRYRYVIDTGASLIDRNDPRAREVTNSVGDSVVVDPNAFQWTGNLTAPAWNDLVLYEAHVGTFNDLPGGAPGTFATAIQRLDHLRDLGVNALSLMPVNEFAGDYSWGYNPGHVFAPESAYGNVADLKALVQAANARGITVLLDVLYNHWGPNDLATWQFDGWSQGGYGGLYFYNDARAQTPWGTTRPDYGRGEVRSFIRDNALMWLEEFRCGGLRFDATLYIRTGPTGDLPDGWSLMQWVNNEIDARQPAAISIAEDLQNNDWITKPTSVGGAGFDAQWDASFVHPVRAALETPNDGDRNMWSVRDALTHRYNADAFERVVYTESHDEVANGRTRVPEAIWPGNAASYYSKKRSTLGAGLVMTAPGIPMLFQGQEVLEDGWFQDTDPVDWSREVTFAGIETLYRDLIRLRRDWFGTTRGLKGQYINVHHVNDGAKVLAFHRWMNGGPGDDVVIVANFSNQAWSGYTIGFPRSGAWQVRFNSDWNGYDAGYGNHPSGPVQANAGAYDGMPNRGSVSIGPYTLLILSQ
ncbi:MAG: alpha-amylase family glycosyl hydrolase [Planctomycetota bacterium]